MLVIDNVQGTDAGEYRCRADFYRAPTTISHMKLDVIGIGNAMMILPPTTYLHDHIDHNQLAFLIAYHLAYHFAYYLAYHLAYHLACQMA